MTRLVLWIYQSALVKLARVIGRAARVLARTSTFLYLRSVRVSARIADRS